MYTVDFGTGVGNLECKTLAEAKAKAVEKMTYTQTDVRILEDEKEDYISIWRNVIYKGGEEELADFGKFGYYSEWYEGKDYYDCKD